MNWNTTTTGIKGEIAFKDQTELAAFVLRLAKVSDELQHHADMDIRYNKLYLNVFTHDKQDVTDKDRDLCKEIEKLMA